ncbi:MAG: hypothetical protein WC607_04830 [Candidatus Micrarchaeia archaeon]
MNAKILVLALVAFAGIVAADSTIGGGSGSPLADIIVITPANGETYVRSADGAALDLEFTVNNFWSDYYDNADSASKPIPTTGYEAIKCGYELKRLPNYDTLKSIGFNYKYYYSQTNTYKLAGEFKNLVEGDYELMVKCVVPPVNVFEDIVYNIPFIGELLIKPPKTEVYSKFHYSPEAVQVPCVDSDGNDPFVMGYCEETVPGDSSSIPVSSAVQHWDACVDAQTLNEYYCGGEYNCFSSLVTCQYGCADGVCLSEPSAPGMWCETLPGNSECANEGEQVFDMASKGPTACCDGLLLEACTGSCPLSVLGTCVASKTESFNLELGDKVEFAGIDFSLQDLTDGRARVKDESGSLTLFLDEDGGYEYYNYSGFDVGVSLSSKTGAETEDSATLKLVFIGHPVKQVDGEVCLLVSSPLEAGRYEPGVSLTYSIVPPYGTLPPFQAPEGYDVWNCGYALDDTVLVYFEGKQTSLYTYNTVYGVTEKESLNPVDGAHHVSVQCSPARAEYAGFLLNSDAIEFVVADEASGELPPALPG